MSFGGVDFYTGVIDKAALLCVRLARNHPLPYGNKRVAYLALVEFSLGTALSGHRRRWTRRLRQLSRSQQGRLPSPNSPTDGGGRSPRRLGAAEARRQ